MVIPPLVNETLTGPYDLKQQGVIANSSLDQTYLELFSFGAFESFVAHIKRLHVLS